MIFVILEAKWQKHKNRALKALSQNLKSGPENPQHDLTLRNLTIKFKKNNLEKNFNPRPYNRIPKTLNPDPKTIKSISENPKP